LTTPKHLRDYQRRLYEECVAAGWDSTGQNSFPEECAHLHEEISEAFRAFRARKSFDTWIDNAGKPQGIPAELADVLIGLFYNAELHGFDLWEAVEQKRKYNRTRNYIAEGRQLHDRR
jgi:NTP pyrophosphatase (non-canonical NTP hydrolase)